MSAFQAPHQDLSGPAEGMLEVLQITGFQQVERKSEIAQQHARQEREIKEGRNKRRKAPRMHSKKAKQEQQKEGHKYRKAQSKDCPKSNLYAQDRCTAWAGRVGM